MGRAEYDIVKKFVEAFGRARRCPRGPSTPPRGGRAGRAAEPDDVAALAVYLLSDESSYATGGEFVIDGGITSGKLLPTNGLR